MWHKYVPCGIWVILLNAHKKIVHRLSEIRISLSLLHFNWHPYLEDFLNWKVGRGYYKGMWYWQHARNTQYEKPYSGNKRVCLAKHACINHTVEKLWRSELTKRIPSHVALLAWLYAGNTKEGRGGGQQREGMSSSDGGNGGDWWWRLRVSVAWSFLCDILEILTEKARRRRRRSERTVWTQG